MVFRLPSSGYFSTLGSILTPLSLNSIGKLLAISGTASRVDSYHNIALLCKQGWVPSRTPGVCPCALRAACQVQRQLGTAIRGGGGTPNHV